MATGDVSVLLNAVVADTNGATFGLRGGHFRFFAYSTAFGAGTAKLQWTPDNGVTWNDVGDGFSLTATGSKEGILPAGQYRGVLTGSTAPAALTVTIAQMTGGL